MAERWHNFVTDAVREVHEDHGFKFLDPCQVWFRLNDDRGVLYRPDAILIRKRGPGTRAVVVEAETNPTAKLVPGDLFMASMVRQPFAEMYPWKDLELGRAVRKERSFTDTYDRRYYRSGRAMDPETQNVITGDEITTLDFVLFTEGEGNRAYFQSYIDLFVQGFPNWPFSSWHCVSVGRRSRREVKQRVNRLLRNL
jgi:hypothetical protein